MYEVFIVFYKQEKYQSRRLSAHEISYFLVKFWSVMCTFNLQHWPFTLGFRLNLLFALYS